MSYSSIHHVSSFVGSFGRAFEALTVQGQASDLRLVVADIAELFPCHFVANRTTKCKHSLVVNWSGFMETVAWNVSIRYGEFESIRRRRSCAMNFRRNKFIEIITKHEKPLSHLRKYMYRIFVIIVPKFKISTVLRADTMMTRERRYSKGYYIVGNKMHFHVQGR